MGKTAAITGGINHVGVFQPVLFLRGKIAVD